MLDRRSIGECVDSCETWNPAVGNAEGEFVYIDIASVDRDEKRIVRASRVLCRNAPSRARQRVRANDVLVSTVRPNLNAVAIVPDELDGATASTGFTVLRTRPEKLDARYLFHWVKAPQFIEQMVRQATGASYPAVSDRIVREAELPVPTLDDQRRIAAILDKADAVLVKRRASILKLDQLLQSVFVDMFGDPVENGKGWQEVKVGDVFSGFLGGKNVECPEESTSPYRILKVSAVTSMTYRPEESKPAPEDFLPSRDSIVESGDLLFSRANTAELVGATAFVWNTPGNIVLPDKLWKMRIADKSQLEPLFAWELFKNPAFRNELSKLSSGTSGSMKNIAKSKLEQVRMPLPPIQIQRRFAKVSNHIHDQLRALHRVCERSSRLVDALQAQAFAGVLREAD